MDRYSSYIASEKWRKKRLEVLGRDSFTCQTCLSGDRLEVHHKTYERLGDERLEDLITLCHECHHAITDVIRRRRYSGRAIELGYVDEQPRWKVEVSNAPSNQFSFDRVVSDYSAQRTNLRPSQQVRQSIEAVEWQAIQNGRGSRRDGAN